MPAPVAGILLSETLPQWLNSSSHGICLPGPRKVYLLPQGSSSRPYQNTCGAREHVGWMEGLDGVGALHFFHSSVSTAPMMAQPKMA